jgi:amino acid transporter
VINGVVGAGIFGLPARIYALAGAYSLPAFVVCAFFIVLLVLCFAEVASRFDDTGGPYLYAQTAFGSFAGFEIGWLMWLTRLTGFAALCNLLVGYLGYFVPAATSGIGRVVSITTVVGAYTLVNILGIRLSAVTSNLFTIGKLIPLLLFVGVGLFFIDTQSYSFAVAPSIDDFSTTVLLLVFAFTGFEVALIPAGETRDPRRHTPFALLAAIGIAAVLYVLIQAVCIGTLPTLAQSHRPLADAAAMFLGAGGATIITAGALISITGTLNTGMIAAPRLLFAMAEHGELPRLLARVHARFHTPYAAILLSAVIMLALSLSATFIAALKISTVIRLITYASTCIALIALRGNAEAQPAGFAVSAGRLIAVAAVALSMWLLLASSWHEILLVAIAAAAGLPIYFACRQR